MQKTNYFETLEALSIECSRVIFLSLESTRARLSSALEECEKIQQIAIKKVCELDLSLFADFLPPIERNNISELGHTILVTIEKCIYIMCQKIQRPQSEKKQKYVSEIKNLSQIIEESIFMLKKIKKPNQTPKISEFREAEKEIRKVLRPTHKKQTPLSNLLYELCEQLSYMFDKIIEIMLCNI